MTPKEMQELRNDEKLIREWLKRINETDEVVINETITAIRIKPEYRKFIVDYAKEESKNAT
jgi:hypothetical protein